MRAGYLAQFPTEQALLEAIARARAQGYTVMDAFSPYPIQALERELGLKRTWLNWWVLPLGLGGAAIGYLIQWYVNAVDYPLNVGGRPPHSWPVLIPITFETAVLFGGIGAFLGYLLFSRLPRWWQPLFEAPGFESASSDKFWLGIDAADPQFAGEHTKRFLQSLEPEQVAAVGKESWS